ncbi:MAG TPA: transposase [Isosphaeraceae bacterium]|nr:transposase [Isosphaeraceae bacterium]
MAKETLERMEAELRTLPLHRQDVERRKKIEAWIDAGHGSCVLREPVVAAMVQDVFRFFHGQRYRLLAWVIMPNHVHVLFQPIDGWTVAKIVASWKKFTAKPISHHRKALRNANLLIGVGDEAANREIGVGNEAAHREIGVGDEAAHREIGGPERGEPIWHREYWDRYMRDEEHFRQAVGYIHDNPVKAGPVANAEDWRWSSACPGNAGNAHREIGVGDEEANREIGGPGKGS